MQNENAKVRSTSKPNYNNGIDKLLSKRDCSDRNTESRLRQPISYEFALSKSPGQKTIENQKVNFLKIRKN